MGIGYASINMIKPEITGKLHAKSQKKVFITNIEIIENQNANLENTHTNSIEGTLLNNKLELSDKDKDSYITYKIIFYNNSSIDHTYQGAIYDKDFYDNENIIFNITGLSEGDKILAKGEKTLTIKFNYKDKEKITNTILNSVINFQFKPVSSIMEDKIIAKYAPDGEETLPTIDFDTMDNDERKQMFSDISKTSGLYKTGGFTGESVYIFRGDINDNYVYFGGYLWRIIQIDGNGNLRVILDTPSITSIYNNIYTIENENEFKEKLGFQNSEAKTNLETSYGYLKGYGDYIVKSNFCNNFDYKIRTSTGSKNQVYYFQSYENIGKDSGAYYPELACKSEYLFTSDIGLISAEEVVLAGGSFEKSNTSYFLYNPNIKSKFWTLSPAFYDTTRKNADVFMIGESGNLIDWTKNLLQEKFYLRPVITLNGDYDMHGEGTKDNPYTYDINYIKAKKQNITDLSTLNNNSYYIGHTGGVKNVDGILSDILREKGLLGKGTAAFSEDKSEIVNSLGIELTFINGKKLEDGYTYQLKTKTNKYLKINTDNSIELVEDPVTLKIKQVTEENYTGRIIISNEEETEYLNFYGGASNEGDDRYAGWNEIDLNAYMVLYKQE